MSRALILLMALALTLAAQVERPDLLVADFEAKTYGDWKTTGDAFGKGPARGALPNQMPVSGFQGEGLVNSFLGGDKATGTLTSPEFRVERKFLAFLIGGGGIPGKTCMNLLHEGKVVRTATGPNTQAGGSETLDAHAWDLADLAGKSVRLEIVDQATGGWGHINVDHIVQTDKKPTGLQAEAKREILAEKKYLTIPVQTGQPKRKVAVFVEGKPWREFEVELASTKTDFEAVLDLSEARGKKLTLRAERIPEKLAGWDGIATSDQLPDTATAYKEKHRPGFHFTSRRGWLNDPNGMVFHDGQWHLYYQHNPYGWAWGNMHWGHATSKDLFRWKEQPIAIYPPRFGDWAFSGSAVVDKANTAGWKQEADVLVAAWTSTGRGECISYSTNRGQTWKEYEGNPVVKHKGRDPRLLWHAPSKQWTMSVYDEAQGKQWIAFYTSPDLKKWTYQSRIDGFYECPDHFELPIEGDPGKTAWVLYGADGKYLLGDFDGKTFTPTTPAKLQLWHGNFYAAQTFSDVGDGRRIQIGWGRGTDFPGMPFNQQMTVPCQLTLHKTSEGVRMRAEPVKELSSLARDGGHSVAEGITLEADKPRAIDAKAGDLWDIRVTLSPGDAKQVTLTLRGIPIVYDAKAETLTCRGKSMPLKAGKQLSLRVLIDRGTVEIFAQNGQVALVASGLLSENQNYNASCTGGSATIDRIEKQALRSAGEEQ